MNEREVGRFADAQGLSSWMASESGDLRHVHVAQGNESDRSRHLPRRAWDRLGGKASLRDVALGIAAILILALGILLSAWLSSLDGPVVVPIVAGLLAVIVIITLEALDGRL